MVTEKVIRSTMRDKFHAFPFLKSITEDEGLRW